MKYFNFKRYKFSTVLKSINTLGYGLLKIFKFADLGRYDFRKIYKYLDIRKFYLTKIAKYLNPYRYNINRIFYFTKVTKYFYTQRYNINRLKKINFINHKFLYPTVFFIFLGLLYLAIPTFYNYDRSHIESIICKNQNIECSIRGKVNYRFFPTPRINIKNLIIDDVLKKKNTLIKVKDAAIILSIKNLLTKEKQNFKKIDFHNFEINFDLKNLQKYKNIFKEKINFVPIIFTKGKIMLYDGENYVATVSEATLNLKLEQDYIEAKLKGNFLNDKIYISINSKTLDEKNSTDIILKMSNLNLLAKANLFNSKKDKDTTSGNILIKKGKNKLTSIFDYKNNELIINKSNLKNTFIDGILEGKIRFLPYFNFDLDVNLNNMNFTKLYNYFLTLDEKSKKKLFKINNKINGNLILSSDKIYSSYNLIKSFESRVKFNNSNILIEQLLINLGKLGAADLLGSINNDKKFTNFKFESNIFVDNQKKFLSKMGIYNKESIPSSLFVSGNFDLDNLRVSFYEISDNEQLKNEDVNYIEKEFNDLMLGDGYESLFYFPKFKEFIKLIMVK